MYYLRAKPSHLPIYLSILNNRILKYKNQFLIKRMSLTHTTDANFDQDVLQSDVPVLLDFWAEWCGPCKMIGPLLVELSEEYAKKVKIVKLNVDENNNTAIQYAVRSIPTLILFKDGQVQAQHIGAAAKGQLKQFIDSNL